jgi:hypothetical protein
MTIGRSAGGVKLGSRNLVPTCAPPALSYRLRNMSWRQNFLRNFGPGMLAGITLSQWVKLLWNAGARIDASRLPRVLAITTQSLKNELMARLEQKRCASAVKDVALEPPLFILGHWRSGTTYLHELLAADTRFAYPTNFQVAFPLTFLTAKAFEYRFLSFFLPSHRPMDNMKWSLDSPQEEEFALCSLTSLSPCMGWVFPQEKERFDRYLTFDGASAAEVAAWKQAFENLLKKLQWHYRRPLILKSPPHTARIGLLLEMFPQARFVHIHRDPYRVFQSSRHTFQVIFGLNSLQRLRSENADDWIIHQYKEMYDSYFRHRSSIPTGQLYELGYEQLEGDPEGEVCKLYHALALPDFEVVRPKLRQYLSSITGFKKNRFDELAPELRSRISREWRWCFEQWGYPA